MPPPKDNYLWVVLTAHDCRHDLLVRTHIADIESEESELAADHVRQRLVSLYLTKVLAVHCRNEHHLAFRGTSEIEPPGELARHPGGAELPVWIVPLQRVPRSNYVFGSAPSAALLREALFAAKLPEGALRWPAEQVTAFLMTERQLA